MPRVQSAGSASASTSTSTPHSLKRNQACHQCRKRKLKCNAQKPCSTCSKSHRLAVAANPALAGTEPGCTYDEFTPENPAPPPEGPRAKYQRLEKRINELETLLKEQGSQEADASAASLPTPVSVHPSPNSFLPDLGVESINSDLSGFLSTPPQASGSSSNGKPNPFAPSSSLDIYSSANVSSGAGQLIFGEWPRQLPPPDLLHHLIELFFNCYPHAHYLLHRPTFMASLTFSPKSPAFPHSSLLHSICAYASIFSPRVETPPPGLPDDLFDKSPQVDDTFAERHVRWSRQARDEATSTGSNLVECTQSLVIMVGYYHLQGRWVELWAAAGLALRYCVPLGLNNRIGFHNARTHPKTWLRNGGRSILPEAPNAIERESRINLFWIAYSYERFQTAPGPWAMSLDDEDINQVFPGRLDDFEAGSDIEHNRQTMQTPQFLSIHPPETSDSFVLYIKASVLLSKVKILNLRVGHRYPNFADVRETPAFRHLESAIAIFRSTFPPGFQEPISTTAKGFDTQLYVAHLIPHVAIILMHEEHAQMDSPNCLSTQKSMLAARAILDLVYIVCSTSYDITRLPPVTTFGWLMAARVLIRVLKHKYQAGLRTEAATLRSEVDVVRLAFSQMAERIPLAVRHLKMIDDLLDAELINIDDTIYASCRHEEIYDPAFINEGASYDFPAGGSASLVEVTSQDSSAAGSNHAPTPDLGLLPDTMSDMGPILTDFPTSASATLEQLLQSMDADSFLLASGTVDFPQIPLL